MWSEAICRKFVAISVIPFYYYDKKYIEPAFEETNFHFLNQAN